MSPFLVGLYLVRLFVVCCLLFVTRELTVSIRHARTHGTNAAESNSFRPSQRFWFKVCLPVALFARRPCTPARQIAKLSNVNLQTIVQHEQEQLLFE